MIQTTRLSAVEIKKVRTSFWLIWTVLMSMPASAIALLLSEGSWWASPVVVTISVVIAYNVFEIWLKRRQWRADNILVLCECGHTSEAHGMTQMSCWNDDDRDAYMRKYCPCLIYRPRFWLMAKRT